MEQNEFKDNNKKGTVGEREGPKLRVEMLAFCRRVQLYGLVSTAKCLKTPDIQHTPYLIKRTMEALFALRHPQEHAYQSCSNKTLAQWTPLLEALNTNDVFEVLCPYFPSMQPTMDLVSLAMHVPDLCWRCHSTKPAYGWIEEVFPIERYRLSQMPINSHDTSEHVSRYLLKRAENTDTKHLAFSATVDARQLWEGLQLMVRWLVGRGYTGPALEDVFVYAGTSDVKASGLVLSETSDALLRSVFMLQRLQTNPDGTWVVPFLADVFLLDNPTRMYSVWDAHIAYEMTAYLLNQKCGLEREGLVQRPQLLGTFVRKLNLLQTPLPLRWLCCFVKANACYLSCRAIPILQGILPANKKTQALREWLLHSPVCTFTGRIALPTSLLSLLYEIALNADENVFVSILDAIYNVPDGDDVGAVFSGVLDMLKWLGETPVFSYKRPLERPFLEGGTVVYEHKGALFRFDDIYPVNASIDQAALKSSHSHTCLLY